MQSNILLRFGGLRDDYKQKVARSPSIWAYARSAGLKTVYMYGQRGGLNENFMTDAEREEVDEARYFRDVEPTLRDHQIARELAIYLANDTPEFILIGKVGAHFPLSWTLPPDTKRTEILGFGQTAKDAKFWQKYREYYREAVSRAVGDFFDIALQENGSSAHPATVIYTSDHGQTFYERSPPGSVTHCRNNAVAEEGSVPLVEIQRGPAGSIKWDASISQRHDASSTMRIFPSLLITMGYDPAAVRAEYGSTLAQADADPMTFGVNMAMKQGSDPRWIEVDPGKIFRPQSQSPKPTEANANDTN